MGPLREVVEKGTGLIPGGGENNVPFRRANVNMIDPFHSSKRAKPRVKKADHEQSRAAAAKGGDHDARLEIMMTW